MTAVWYLGTSTTRSISSAAWASAGLTGLSDSVWNAGNGYSINAGAFTSDQIELLNKIGEFKTNAPDGPRDHSYVASDDWATQGWVLEQIAQGGGDFGVSSIVTAGETVSGHRAVVLHTDDLAYYASNDDLDDTSRQIWITLGAAIEGTDLQILPLGMVTEPSWNWIDAPIFLGANGVLTQTPPIAPAFLVQLAQPTGPTSLVFNPRGPIILV